ncbi:MAG: hypothetical protein Q9227_003847 [Pyrenula ochraceoflavens]
MGDHVCSSGMPTKSLLQSDVFARPRRPERAPDMGFGSQATFLKPGRQAPPQIDPSAANRPFLRPNELTPASSGASSYGPSPITPSSGRRMPFRSMTAPSPQGPPSPEFSNLDCAFPPFVSSRSGTPRTGTPVSESRGSESHFDNDYVREHAEPYNLGSRGHSRGRSATSVRSRSGSSLGARDISRPSTANSNRRRPSLASLGGGPRPSTAQQPPVPNLPPQGFSELQRLPMRDNDSSAPKPFRPQGGYGGLGDSPALPENPYNPYKFEPYRQDKAQGLGLEFGQSGNKSSASESELFLPQGGKEGERGPLFQRPPNPVDKSLPTRPSNGSIPSPTRSQTFPRHNENRDSGIGRRPSEPVPRHSRSPSPGGHQILDDRGFETSPSRQFAPEPNFSPDRGRRQEHQPSKDFFPPRNSSRKRGLNSLRPDPLPPMPDFASDLDIGNPYHTPSDSGSSHLSSLSGAQTTSSRSTNSPPPPASPFHKRSGTRERNLLGGDMPAPLRLGASKYGVPESPTDPLMQKGRLSPIPPPNPKHTYLPPSSASVISSSSTSSRPRRNPTLSSTKGTCRACSLPITGKSVSSADGRLTGKYHKECFVCKTCGEPFRTTDFYVLNDHPYCGQHYHALNGSLCASCGNGIEGPFLETAVTQSKGQEKFHPDCFACTTCRIQLSDDYFELMGKPYCERDAFRATQTQGHRRGPSLENTMSSGSGKPRGWPPGGPPFLGVGLGNGNPGRTMSGRNRFPERRTTKLMMNPGGMMPGGMI